MNGHRHLEGEWLDTYHNIRNEYSLGTIAPEHCKGVELFADMLTKPLGGDDHYKRCATHPGFDWGR